MMMIIKLNLKINNKINKWLRSLELLNNLSTKLFYEVILYLKLIEIKKGKII